MASRSSSDHPESSHPYHGDRSHSTSTTESRGRKRTGILARLILPSFRQGLLPLPAGARLSSSSPPPSLPRIPQTPFDLPHLSSTPITEGDSTWAATYESPPLPPVMVLGMPILQHPQPLSAQVSSGIMSPSPSAPTSLPHAMGRLSTEPLPRSQPPHSIEERPMSGIDQSTTWEPALEPVRDEEPVASGSTLPVPNDSSYWSNVFEQRPGRRTRLHRRRWGRIDQQLTAEPRPPPELLAPP